MDTNREEEEALIFELCSRKEMIDLTKETTTTVCNQREIATGIFGQPTTEDIYFVRADLQHKIDLKISEPSQENLNLQTLEIVSESESNSLDTILNLKLLVFKLNQENLELTKLLETVLVSKDREHVSITNNSNETIRFSVASDKVQKCEVGTQTVDSESGAEENEILKTENIAQVKTEFNWD